MKFGLLLLCIYSFCSSAYAFPTSDLEFRCPNTFSSTEVVISLKWQAAEQVWTGILVESSKDAILNSTEGLLARFVDDHNRMEISKNEKTVGLMTQIDQRQSIYKDGKFVLNCAF